MQRRSLVASLAVWTMLVATCVFAAAAPAPDPFTVQRLRMVDTQIAARGVTDPLVLQAMRKVPRHLFVERRYWDAAYGDHPLPIGFGQTISQPYIVALMTEKVQVRPGTRVLEIGTGSGYQAAVLAEITDHVYTIEIIEPLAEQARDRLRKLGYARLQTRTADGYFGWLEAAPFDAILVTAAPDHVPPPLLTQLKDGGRMVVPVGPPGLVQTLWLITRRGDQNTFENLGPVLFVPLRRR